VYSSTLSLTSAIDVMGGQGHAPVVLPPGKRPDTHCIGGWVSPRAGLDGYVKSCPLPGFDSRTVLSVASRYTDLAIQAHINKELTDHMWLSNVDSKTMNYDRRTDN
jgi:hypothetical protein